MPFAPFVANLVQGILRPLDFTVGTVIRSVPLDDPPLKEQQHVRKSQGCIKQHHCVSFGLTCVRFPRAFGIAPLGQFIAESLWSHCACGHATPVIQIFGQITIYQCSCLNLKDLETNTLEFLL